MTAVIYARYSSDSQREASIEGQLRDCKDYAERNGITIVGTYIDRAYSAKTDDRPEFQRMIQENFFHGDHLVKRQRCHILDTTECIGENRAATVTGEIPEFKCILREQVRSFI